MFQERSNWWPSPTNNPLYYAMSEWIEKLLTEHASVKLKSLEVSLNLTTILVNKAGMNFVDHEGNVRTLNMGMVYHHDEYTVQRLKNIRTYRPYTATLSVTNFVTKLKELK